MLVSPALRLQLRLHIYNGIRAAGQRDEGQHAGLPSFQLDILTATADMSACLQVSDSRSQGHSLLFSRHSSSTLSLRPSFPTLCTAPLPESSNALITLTADASPLYCSHKYSRVENNEAVLWQCEAELMSLLSTADSFMCYGKDQNEKVSVGVVMDKANRPDSTMHSRGHVDLSADISLL